MTFQFFAPLFASLAFLFGFAAINLNDAVTWIWAHGWESLVILAGAIAGVWRWYYNVRKSEKASGWQSELESTKARNDIIDTLQNQIDNMAERQAKKDLQIDELEEKVSYLMRYVRSVKTECPECHEKVAEKIPFLQ